MPRRKTAFHSDEGLENFRIEVGRDHGVKPSNIVGAIANETGLSSKQIGQIEIFADHSIVGLPGDMPREILEHLKKVWVANQQLKISKVKERATFKNKKSDRGKPDRKRR
jgi:ATP-dependent RNA helicase DeaD